MSNVIINIRGTYGSGKTTLARFVMDNYLDGHAHYVPGRKRPLYYTFTHPNGGTPLAVIGSYETVCGGCDTIGEIKDIFETIDFLREDHDVLYESLLLTADCARTIKYYQSGWNLQVIYLDVPTQVCLDSVNQRRRAKDPQAADVDPKNLLAKVDSCRSSQKNLDRNGVPTHLLNRAEAFIKCAELLNLPSIL